MSDRSCDGTILITGATGLLGCELAPHLRARGWTVVTHALTSNADYCVDLTEPAETAAMLDRVRPHAIVNLAALTDVDACERDPHRAYALNVLIVEHICRWIYQGNANCHLIHVSTDQLYDGTGPHPEEGVHVTNVYAFSKVAAEIAARRVNATVLRTNFFGPSRQPTRKSFTDWLHGSLSERRHIKVFDDVLFSPLAMDTVAEMIALALSRRPQGVFNLGSRNGMSKADFGFAFASATGLPTDNMQRASAASTSLIARRPTDMRMDVRRLEQALNVTLPDLRTELNRIGRVYRERA